MSQIKKFFFTAFLVLSLSPVAQAARPQVVARADPFPRFQGYRQYAQEKICWAVAAKMVLKNLHGRNESACAIVGKTIGRQCCGGNNSLLEACNDGNKLHNALAAYGKSYLNSAVDFARAFNALQNGNLVGIVMDVRASMFGGRNGHVAIIYAATKLSDASYEFYVADSANGWYNFNTKDLRRRDNGKYRYSSFTITFDWENMVLAYR